MHCTIFLLIFAPPIVYSINTTEYPIVNNEEVTETFTLNFSNRSVVSETQHTICSIKTDEIVAKAQSTASRILTGVCSSEEMAKAFKKLEETFLEKLEQIQQNMFTIFLSKQQSATPRRQYKNTQNSALKTIDYLLAENLLKNRT